MNATTTLIDGIDLAHAYRVNDCIRATQVRVNGEHGDGWNRPRMTSMYAWHLFPGARLEAKYDSRLTEDVTVVGAPQHDNHWHQEYLLVENDRGDRYTLTCTYKACWYATVTPLQASAEYFHAATTALVYRYTPAGA